MSSKFEDLKELQAMLERGEVTQAQYDVVRADLLADVSQDSSPMEPGWYNDPSGQASQQAYWDGSNWTGVTRPDPGIGKSPSSSQVAAAKAPIYKRGWFVALVVVLGVAFVGAALTEDTDTQAANTESRASSDNTQSRASSDDTEAPTPTTPAPASQFTRSEENAIRSAESYLNFSAFSRSGLIGQLEYEGFTNAEATLAVDHLDVDWNEQAALSAESYLDFAAFSESGLIKQLEFEGFTSDQATRGVNSITVDWNEQAWRSAESYLEFSGFSRSGLIDQLLFEGFTQSQATYGVDKAGL
jgi:hypothetical protein